MKLSLFVIAVSLVVFVVAIALTVFVAKKLIGASKKETQNEEGGTLALESQIRNSLSKARQQRFKADSKLRRLSEWANDAIVTTYSDLFPEGIPYSKTELLINYDELKSKHGERLSYEQMDKCDNIVIGYQNQIEAEKAKIVTFDKIQKEYEDLKEKVRISRNKERKQNKLDKHSHRLKNAQDDITADTEAFEQTYKLEDLTKEVALKEEYINQLEQLTHEYGDDISTSKSLEYKNSVDNILKKYN